MTNPSAKPDQTLAALHPLAELMGPTLLPERQVAATLLTWLVGVTSARGGFFANENPRCAERIDVFEVLWKGAWRRCFHFHTSDLPLTDLEPLQWRFGSCDTRSLPFPIGTFAAVGIRDGAAWGAIVLIDPATANEGSSMQSAMQLASGVWQQHVDRRRSAQESTRAAESLRAALSPNTAGYWEVDMMTGDLHTIGYEDALGYKDEEMPVSLRQWHQRVHPDDLPNIERAYRDYHSLQPPRFECEYRVRNAQGAWVWLRGRGMGTTFLREQEPPLRMAGLDIDISDEKALQTVESQRPGDTTPKTTSSIQQQQALANASRLQTMSELVAAIAHEITQPLGAISNFASACRTRIQHAYQKDSPLVLDCKAGSQVLSWTNSVIELCQQAGRIVDRLRRFSKLTSPQRSTYNLNELLEESVRLHLAEAFQLSVEMRLNLEPRLPRAIVDEVQMHQVLSILIRNAFEATEGNAADRVITISSHVASDEILISVTDNGPGVSPSIADSIYEPLMSSRAHQIGVGLATAKAIVEAHHGRLWHDKSAASGAAFYFSLPLAGDTSDTADTSDSQPGS